MESASFHLLSTSPVYSHFLDAAGVKGHGYSDGPFSAEFDLAIVDTAPGFYRFPEELEQVLNASKKVYVTVPLASDFRALNLAEDALDYFELIREYFPHSLFTGAFLTLNRSERKIAEEILGDLAGLKSLRIFDTFIPFEEALASVSYDRPLREILPHSPVTAAYSALAHEITALITT
jgi:cellulose biosynthesis protein BcsQ